MWFFWLGPCRSTGLESSSIERGVCLKQRMVLMVCIIEKQGQFFLFVLWQPCMSFGVQDRSACKYCCCLFLVQFSVISSADAVRKFLIFAWIVVHVALCDCSHMLLRSFVTYCTGCSDGQGANVAASQSTVTPKSQNPQEYVRLLSLHFLF
jgi:hypothetical protein